MSNCVWVNLVDALLGGGRWMDVEISRRSSWSILIFPVVVSLGFSARSFSLPNPDLFHPIECHTPSFPQWQAAVNVIQ